MSRPTVGLKITKPEPGYKTLVRDDSAKGLPTDLDREQQTNLPPDSATPRVPDDPKSEGGGGGGRVLPTYENNTPDNGIADRPRSLPTPGEEYGHPTKFDYNYVTRRDMNASKDEPEERTAYTREWHSGKFQHRQKGLTRTKSRQQYRRNRNKYKMQAKIRYKRNKRNPQFRKLQEHRRQYPHMHQRRRASSIIVASLFLAEMMPSAEVVADRFLEAASHDWNVPKRVPPPKKQHRQRGDDRVESKREYVQAPAAQKNRVMKLRHKKLMKFKRYRKYKQWYNEQYAAHGDTGFRRHADVLTTPQISFGIGKELLPGTVHNISPMTGLVTFVVDAKDYEPLRSMPIRAFLQVVVFYSEDDIDAFFDLVDVEIGPEAYDDIDGDIVRACAAEFDVDVDSEEFADQCMNLVGVFDLESMTPDQLEQVNHVLVLQTLEGGHGRTRIDTEDLDDGDPGEGDEYDWHLYYGEVPDPDPIPEEVTRVAARWLQAEGITFTYEVENPKQEIDYPASGSNYEPTSPSHYRRDQGDDDDRAPGHSMPSNESDDVPAGSSRVVPPGDGQLEGIGLRPRTAATINDLAHRTGPDVHAKAKGVPVRLRRADPQRGIWTFQARGSKGETYTIRVKGRRQGNVQNLSRAQVQVSCSCPFFRWQGPEHWAKANSYLYGRPRGTASKPDIKDPAGKHWACKHIIACFRLAHQYKLAHTGGQWWPLGAEVVPEWSMEVRVAERWLNRTRS